jgi:hypothetical protein
MIDAKEIELKEELGTGEFGSVMRGEWKRVCAVTYFTEALMYYLGVLLMVECVVLMCAAIAFMNVDE